MVQMLSRDIWTNESFKRTKFRNGDPNPRTQITSPPS